MNKINENPDIVVTPTKNLTYNDSEAIPFTYDSKNDKMYSSNKLKSYTHCEIGDDPEEIVKIRNIDLQSRFDGRIWIKSKYISFWDYPNNTSIQKKLIKNLEKVLKIKIINNGYKVEINQGKSFNRQAPMIPDSSTKNFLSLDDFIKNKNKPSASFKRMQHVKQSKFNRKVPKGVGSKKKVSGLTQTQYHQKKYTSEELLRKVIQKLLKESPDRIHFRNDTIYFDSGKPAAFGYFVPFEKQFKKNDKLYFKRNGKHYEFRPEIIKDFSRDELNANLCMKTRDMSIRDSMTYTGRIWLDEKLISFWDYPKSRSEKIKVIKDLEKASKQKILNNPEWLIEIDDGEFETAIHFITGKDISYTKWKSTQHVKQGRFDRIVPKGVGSEKSTGKISKTQAFQKTYTSEELLRKVIQKMLKESPDYLRTLDGNSLEYTDKEAHAFTYVKKNNKLLISKKGEMHLNIFLKNLYLDDINLEKYNGRIWIKHKYISFWDYPNNISIHKKIIKGLEKELKIKILNNNYKVEISLNKFVSVEEFLGTK